MSQQNPQTGIDPRGPRFAAGITATLLAATIVFALLGNSVASLGASGTFGWVGYKPLPASIDHAGFVLPYLSVLERTADVGFILLAVVAALFAWGLSSPKTAPWGVLYRKLVQPKLPKPTELEDPRPPRFAQGVGLLVAIVGVVLHLAGVPLALPIAAAAAFIAAFLNAVFDYCLGCQLYLLLQRLRPRATA